MLHLGIFCSARAGGHLDHKIRTYVICVHNYFSSVFFLFFFFLLPFLQVNLNYNPWKIKFSSSSSSPLALSKYFH